MEEQEKLDPLEYNSMIVKKPYLLGGILLRREHHTSIIPENIQSCFLSHEVFGSFIDLY